MAMRRPGRKAVLPKNPAAPFVSDASECPHPPKLLLPLSQRGDEAGQQAAAYVVFSPDDMLVLVHQDTMSDGIRYCLVENSGLSTPACDIDMQSYSKPVPCPAPPSTLSVPPGGAATVQSGAGGERPEVVQCWTLYYQSYKRQRVVTGRMCPGVDSQLCATVFAVVEQTGQLTQQQKT